MMIPLPIPLAQRQQHQAAERAAGAEPGFPVGGRLGVVGQGDRQTAELAHPVTQRKSLPVAESDRFDEHAGVGVDDAGQGEAHAGNGRALPRHALDGPQHRRGDLPRGRLRGAVDLRRQDLPAERPAQVVDQADAETTALQGHADEQRRLGLGQGKEFASRRHSCRERGFTETPSIRGVCNPGKTLRRTIAVRRDREPDPLSEGKGPLGWRPGGKNRQVAIVPIAGSGENTKPSRPAYQPTRKGFRGRPLHPGVPDRARRGAAIGRTRREPMVSLPVVLSLVVLSGGPGRTEMLDFGGDRCIHCRAMDPAVRDLEGMGYPVRRVNIDQEPALAAQFGVTEHPLLRDAGRRARGGSRGGRDHLRPAATDVQQGTGGQPALPAPAAKTAAAIAVPVSAPRPKGPVVSDATLIAQSVRLRVEDPDGRSCGSGTIIDARQGEALILTCGHIFRDSKGKGPIEVDLFGPGGVQRVPGKLICLRSETTTWAW